MNCRWNPGGNTMPGQRGTESNGNEGLVWFGYMAYQKYSLFNARSFLYIYIKCMILKNIFLITF